MSEVQKILVNAANWAYNPDAPKIKFGFCPERPIDEL